MTDTADTKTPAQRVYVDVVSPGKALIAFAGVDFSGLVSRQGARLAVWANGTDEFVGSARTYKAAGVLLAKYHGITDVDVVVDYE